MPVEKADDESRNWEMDAAQADMVDEKIYE
jgi:hypothetical protein